MSRKLTQASVGENAKVIFCPWIVRVRPWLKTKGG